MSTFLGILAGIAVAAAFLAGFRMGWDARDRAGGQKGEQTITLREVPLKDAVSMDLMGNRLEDEPWTPSQD